METCPTWYPSPVLPSQCVCVCVAVGGVQEEEGGREVGERECERERLSCG